MPGERRERAGGAGHRRSRSRSPRHWRQGNQRGSRPQRENRRRCACACLCVRRDEGAGAITILSKSGSRSRSVNQRWVIRARSRAPAAAGRGWLRAVPAPGTSRGSSGSGGSRPRHPLVVLLGGTRPRSRRPERGATPGAAGDRGEPRAWSREPGAGPARGTAPPALRAGPVAPEPPPGAAAAPGPQPAPGGRRPHCAAHGSARAPLRSGCCPRLAPRVLLTPQLSQSMFPRSLTSGLANKTVRPERCCQGWPLLPWECPEGKRNALLRSLGEFQPQARIKFT